MPDQYGIAVIVIRDHIRVILTLRALIAASGKILLRTLNHLHLKKVVLLGRSRFDERGCQTESCTAQ